MQSRKTKGLKLGAKTVKIFVDREEILIKTFVSVALAGVFLAVMASADPVFGVWKTQPGSEGNYAHVEIKECDGKICGEMIKAFDSSDEEIDSKNIGRNIIIGMSPKKGSRYGGGKIWAPDEDKTYRSKMKLVGDADLKVSGCIAIICRKQDWSRVK